MNFVLGYDIIGVCCLLIEKVMSELRTKVCRICNQETAWDDLANDKTAKDGKQSRCKKCQAIKAKERRDRDPEKTKEIKRKTRLNKKLGITVAEQKALAKATITHLTCTKCSVTKPLSEFYDRKKNVSTGKVSQCKTCIDAKNRKWVKDNPERVSELSKQHYHSMSPEERYERHRKYVDKDPERFKQYYKKWASNNKDKVAYFASEKRAKMKQATIKDMSAQEKNAIKALFKLAQQQTKDLGTPYHVDHIVPLQSDKVCGLHCLANLRVILGSENIKKNNKHWPDMWDPWPEDKKDGNE